MNFIGRGQWPHSIVSQQLTRRWMDLLSWPSQSLGHYRPDGHENTLGGDTGEWWGRVTRPRRQRRG